MGTNSGSHVLLGPSGERIASGKGKHFGYVAPDERVVRERPILFSSAMVLALLAGRKTQTRRVVKLPKSMKGGDLSKARPDLLWGVTPGLHVPMPDGTSERLRNPWGWPEPSRIWVRETWGYRGMGHLNYGPKGRRAECYLHYAADDSRRTLYAADESGWTKLPKQKPAQPLPADISEEDECDAIEARSEYLTAYWSQWRPSIFMPRWASRITLEVTGVRVERLQDISDADARAEGLAFDNAGCAHFMDGGSAYVDPVKPAHFSPRRKPTMTNTRRDGIAEPELLNPAPACPYGCGCPKHGKAVRAVLPSLLAEKAKVQLFVPAPPEADVMDPPEQAGAQSTAGASGAATGCISTAPEGARSREYERGFAAGFRQAHDEERDGKTCSYLEGLKQAEAELDRLKSRLTEQAQSESEARAEVERLNAERAQLRKALEYPVAADGHNLPLLELAQSVADSCDAHETAAHEARGRRDSLERELSALRQQLAQSEAALAGARAAAKQPDTLADMERNYYRDALKELQAQKDAYRRVVADLFESARTVVRNPAAPTSEEGR